jgi:IclR family transcriptional regulator, acetate operon repressor
MPKAHSAIEKALLVVEHVAAEQRPVSLAALAAATDMPKQTVHRVLQQLEHAQAVQRSFRSGSYILGRRMRGLAVAALQATAATLPVRDELERLANQVGESANLGVLNGRRVRYLERVEYAWPLRFTISPNDELPAHAVAIGKLLLAHLPPALRHGLLRGVRFERFTDFTITDPDALEREFDQIVKAGYSMNNQEYYVGLVGVAVPVRDREGAVIAGVAIHGVVTRTSLEQLAGHLPRMHEAAAQIAELLEGSEPSPPTVEEGTEPRGRDEVAARAAR